MSSTYETGIEMDWVINIAEKDKNHVVQLLQESSNKIAGLLEKANKLNVLIEGAALEPELWFPSFDEINAAEIVNSLKFHLVSLRRIFTIGIEKRTLTENKRSIGNSIWKNMNLSLFQNYYDALVLLIEEAIDCTQSYCWGGVKVQLHLKHLEIIGEIREEIQTQFARATYDTLMRIKKNKNEINCESGIECDSQEVACTSSVKSNKIDNPSDKNDPSDKSDKSDHDLFFWIFATEDYFVNLLYNITKLAFDTKVVTKRLNRIKNV
eukprot:Pgem_evm1s19717